MKILLSLLTLLFPSAFLHGMTAKKDGYTVVTNSRGDQYCISSALRLGTSGSEDPDNKELFASIDCSLSAWRTRVLGIAPKNFADFCTANSVTIAVIGEPNFLLY